MLRVVAAVFVGGDGTVGLLGMGTSVSRVSGSCTPPRGIGCGGPAAAPVVCGVVPGMVGPWSETPCTRVYKLAAEQE